MKSKRVKKLIAEENKVFKKESYLCYRITEAIIIYKSQTLYFSLR